MTPEQVTLTAQMLTLTGVVISAIVAAVSSAWANQRREERRDQTAARIEQQLETRAADIRLALEVQAGAVHAQQEALLAALRENTVLTQHGVHRADAAFHEANNINLKLAQAQTDAATALQRTARFHDLQDEG